MRAKTSKWQSSKVIQIVVVGLLGATAAGCSDGNRFGDGPGYAPAPAYGTQSQYRPRPETTGSIRQSAPEPEPWYGRPWQSPQASPPPQAYPQQTNVRPDYQPQPSYSQAPVYTQPLKPQVAVTPLQAPKPAPIVQAVPPVAPATGPRVSTLQPKPLNMQAMPEAPRRTAAPVTTGSTTTQIAAVPVTPIARAPQPMPPAVTQPISAPQTAQAPGSSNWSATGGSYVTMKQGDSISTLSQRYGVPVTAIMSANNFADATRVQPGQQVLIPTYIYNNGSKPVAQAPVQPAPVSTASIQAPQPMPKGGEHVVRHGETLDTVARMYGIPKDKLKAANHIRGETTLRTGQKLEIPVIGGRHVAETPVTPAVPVVPVSTAQLKPGAQTLAAPVKVADAKPVATTASVSESVIAVAQEPKPQVDSPRVDPKAANPSFRWPVRGRVIAEYGSKPGGERNDGINLAVPEGTSVKSAEDGEVIYSGNELKGYGNVVLVKHSDGWVTVYAHASDLLVNKGDKVTRGQIIARAGATGSVTQPQLHFELRKGQKPVDPKTYLTN